MLLAIAGKLENFQENLKPRLSLWEERDGGRFKFSMRLNFTSLIIRRSWSCMLDTSDLERATPNDYDIFFMDRRTFFCAVHIKSSFSSWIDELFLVNCMWTRLFFRGSTDVFREVHIESSFSSWIDGCFLLRCMTSSVFHGTTNFFSVYFGVLRGISSRLFLESTNFSSGVLGT